MFEPQRAGAEATLLAKASLRPVALAEPARGLPQNALRVMIVSESAIVRRTLLRLFDEDARFNTTTARGTAQALEKLNLLRPHVALFDDELPAADIAATLHILRDRHPLTGILFCNALAERCSLTHAAPALNPKNLGPGAFAAHIKQTLLDLGGSLPGFGDTSPAALASPPPSAAGAVAWTPRRAARSGPQILAIGCSTGGPTALAELLPELPADFPLPVVIVQHMPPHFTKLLCERLSRICRIPVLEAEEGMEVRPGVALMAPGDFHMRLVRKLHRVEVQLNQEELENSCRPAVDVLFRSVADIYGGNVITTVLTGMGQDGLKGARLLKEHGAPVLVQDRESSVVWGMPGAIATAGLANSILPLHAISSAILRLL